MHSRIDHLWRALDVNKSECKETKRTSSDTYGRDLWIDVVSASFSFELSRFLCVFENNVSRKVKIFFFKILPQEFFKGENDRLWRALDARRGECKETKRTSSDTHRKELSNGIVYASFSFELSWFLCVENVRLSREKKAKIFIKSDSWSLWISSILCREERDIYTRTDIYIYSLEGKESKTSRRRWG